MVTWLMLNEMVGYAYVGMLFTVVATVGIVGVLCARNRILRTLSAVVAGLGSYVVVDLFWRYLL